MSSNDPCLYRLMANLRHGTGALDGRSPWRALGEKGGTSAVRPGVQQQNGFKRFLYGTH